MVKIAHSTGCECVGNERVGGTYVFLYLRRGFFFISSTALTRLDAFYNHVYRSIDENRMKHLEY